MEHLELHEILDTTVYRLSGHDVLSVLEDMDRADLSQAELAKLVIYLKHNLELPWTEFLEYCIEQYFDLFYKKDTAKGD